MLRLLGAVGLLVGAALLGPSGVRADGYPTKPIKLVVGFPPGGPTDIIGRLIAQNLSKQLGQPIIIENQGGAGGVVGASAVAKAKPDGYTLLVSVESAQTRGLALNPTLPYDQQKDFSFIRKVAKQRNLIVVNPNLPVKDLKELIAYLKDKPGEANFGGTFGATSHIGGTLFDMMNGTKMTFINYPGGSAPIFDLIAGTLQVGFFTEATVAQHVAAGKLKALAVAAPERSPAFPTLPTTAEAGGASMDLSPWFGVAGPQRLPADIAGRLGEALDRMADSKEFQAQLETLGAVPVRGSTADGFTKEVGEEIAFWNKWAQDIKTPLAR